VFARKIIRLFGHVTADDIENEVRAVAALCSGRQCKYVVEVLKHGWLTNANTDYFIDMDYCPETLEERIIQWNEESRRYQLPAPFTPDPAPRLDPAIPENGIESVINTVAVGRRLSTHS
jgi:hypothetical protein